MSVLVTGGAGYIGSHTVKALRATGADVVIYDDLSAGHRSAAKAAGAPLEEGSIADSARLREVMRAHGVDAIMHFAAWLSVSDSVRDPAGYYDNNVGGAIAVLRASADAGVKHFIFSSTAATFGDPIRTPIEESHPQQPINAYGETKLAIERALPHFERAHGIRSVSLRYFNAAGADPDGALGEDHDPELHVIPRAIDAALGRGSFAIFGVDYDTPDGTCLRDYVHVADLADAHLLALESLRAGAQTTAYNLGNGNPVSVRQVIDSVERVTGRKLPLGTGPRRPGDPAVLYASSEKIRRELGWKPQYEAIDVIVETAWRWRVKHPHGYADREAGGAQPAAGSRQPEAGSRKPEAGGR